MSLRVALLGDLATVHTQRLRDGLVARGFAVKAFSMEAFEGEGVYVPPVLKKPQQLRYLLSASRMARALAGFEPQITVAVSLANYGLLAWLLRLSPTYLMVWGSDLLFSARKTPLHKRIAYRILHHARRINVDSTDMFHDLVTVWNIPPERVDFMTWGLSEDWFTPLPDKPPAPPWRVVSTRRLDPDMDPLTLIRGFARAVAQGFVGELHLVGSGVLQRRCESEVHKLGLSGKVVFHGRLPAEAIRRLLDRSHIFAASPIVDSTSVSLLEAMSRGVIPVVTDLPANREWLLHGFSGFLFPMGRPDLLARGLFWATRVGEEARRINRAVVEARARWEVHLDRLARTLENLGGGHG